MLGLAIMMASRWNLPSATNTMAWVLLGTMGAVHPSTSPAAFQQLMIVELKDEVSTC